MVKPEWPSLPSARSRMWKIARIELGRNWIGLIITSFILIYMAMMATFQTDLATNERRFNLDNFMHDVAYIASLSTLGFSMSREYLDYWRSRPFTRRLAVMRTLPIEAKELVAGKYAATCRNLIVNCFVFFGAQYLLAGPISEKLRGWDYLVFVAFWMGIIIFITAGFLYLEMGLAEKMYLKMNMTIGFLLFVSCSLVNFLSGTGIVDYTVELIITYGVIASLLSLIASFSLAAFITKRTVRKLEERDVA